jgi:hypothetical protein
MYRIWGLLHVGVSCCVFNGGCRLQLICREVLHLEYILVFMQKLLQVVAKPLNRSKVNFTLQHAMKAQGCTGIALPFPNLSSRFERVVNTTLRPIYPRRDAVPLHRALGEHQNQSQQVRKIFPSLGFESRTVQPVTQESVSTIKVYSTL